MGAAAEWSESESDCGAIAGGYVSAGALLNYDVVWGAGSDYSDGKVVGKAAKAL